MVREVSSNMPPKKIRPEKDKRPRVSGELFRALTNDGDLSFEDEVQRLFEERQKIEKKVGAIRSKRGKRAASPEDSEEPGSNNVSSSEEDPKENKRRRLSHTDEGNI